MDYASSLLPYDSVHLPSSEGEIDYYAGRKRRIAFGQLSALHSPRKNKLLAALPDADYERVLPHLDIIPMLPGSTLYDADGHSSFAYFPIAGIVSSLCVMENGAAPAVSITGNEGMVGISLFMGGGAAPNRTVVQSAGYAYRLGANRMRQEFKAGGQLCQLLLRYTQSLITQVTQTAVCNRYHSLEQQLCRWLLLSLDRVPTNELCLTHEQLASILGVRREGVTGAAGKLQEAGVIRYRRGHITVLNHIKLKELVCECYAVINGDLNRSAGKCAGHGRSKPVFNSEMPIGNHATAVKRYNQFVSCGI